MANTSTSPGLSGPYAAGSLGLAWAGLLASLARLGRGRPDTGASALKAGRLTPAGLSVVRQKLNEAADAWPLAARPPQAAFVRLDLQLALLKEAALIREQLWGRPLENKALSAEFQALAQELEILRLCFNQGPGRERPAA